MTSAWHSNFPALSALRRIEVICSEREILLRPKKHLPSAGGLMLCRLVMHAGTAHGLRWQLSSCLREVERLWGDHPRNTEEYEPIAGREPGPVATSRPSLAYTAR